MAKQPGKVPYGALVWTAFAGALAYRTFYQPARGIVADGYVSQCAGKTAKGPCAHAMQIESFGGSVPVYSMLNGTVIEVNGGVKIAGAHEPVVLTYDGLDQVQVGLGEKVGLGQQVGLAQHLSFAVSQLEAKGPSEVMEYKIEPASWLAARGLRVSVKAHKSDATGANWCEGGRKLTVPEEAGLCGMRLASPTGFMLLPVSVNMGK